LLIIGWLAEIDILFYVGLGIVVLFFGTGGVGVLIEKLGAARRELRAARREGRLAQMLIAGGRVAAHMVLGCVLVVLLWVLTTVIPLYVTVPWGLLSMLLVWRSPNFVDERWSNAKWEWKGGNHVKSVFMFAWALVLSLFLWGGLLLKLW
jgi:hypothetical protein